MFQDHRPVIGHATIKAPNGKTIQVPVRDPKIAAAYGIKERTK